MIKAHKIRLNPTPEQEQYFWRCCGIARFAWNWALQRVNERSQAKEKLNVTGLKKDFNAAKPADFPFVKEVTSWAYQGAFMDLSAALSNFFDNQKKGTLPTGGKPRKDEMRHGWPRFKARNRTKPAFYLANTAVKFQPHGIYMQRNCGWVDCYESLRFEGKIMSVRVSYGGTRWWASVAVEINHEPEPHPGPAVGIDRGLKSLAVTSDGEVFDNPQALRRVERKLKRLQRQLARKVKGSANWKKQVARIAKQHYKIRCLRQDTIHKMTTVLTEQYGFIGIEDLNVRGMVKNHNLAKSISDAAMSEAGRQLEYKAAWNGGTAQKVGMFYASSKIHHGCGHKNTKLELSDRKWSCKNCGEIVDRDYNAALNIRDEALRIAGL